MSHFMFRRTGRPLEREIINSVVLDNAILEAENNSLSNSTQLSSNNNNTSSSSSSSNNSSSSNSSVVSVAESSDSSTILAPRQPPRVLIEEEARCWICFGDSSDSQGKWVKPCKCTLEAHQSCLLDWIAENQKASPTKKVLCPQCSTPYNLAQSNSVTLKLLTVVDSLVRKGAPYITVLGIGCSLLITCTTYGAFTVMTLLGPKAGERLIGNPSYWTIKTWIGLPMIPVLLISTKTRWGDAILPVAAVTMLRATGHSPQNIRFTWPMSPALTIGIMPWVRLFYKNAYKLVQHYMTKNLSLQESSSITSTTTTTTTTTTTISSNNRQQNRRRGSTNDMISDRERNLELEMINGRDTSSIGLSLLGVLLWPAISSGMGGILNRFKWTRENFPEPFQRNVLGGCLFVVLKDVGNLIYKYERIRQHRSRRVMNYDEVIKSNRTSSSRRRRAAATS